MTVWKWKRTQDQALQAAAAAGQPLEPLAAAFERPVSALAKRLATLSTRGASVASEPEPEPPAAPAVSRPAPRKWTEDEERDMLSALREGRDGQAVASAINRTPHAVYCRQTHVAARMVAGGASHQDAAEATRLSVAEVGAAADLANPNPSASASAGSASAAATLAAENKGRKWRPDD